MPRNRLADVTAQILDRIHNADTGARMPSARQLAAAYGASHVTVLRAIGRLVEQGRVITRPGSGTFVCEKTSHQSTPVGAGALIARREPRGTRASRVLDAIAAELTAGRFPPGEQLPAAKELCAHFGVSRATLRDILMSLRSTGRVQEYGRWWRVRPITAPAEGNTIACIINAKTDFGGVMQLQDRELDLLRAIEKGAQRAGFKLEINKAWIMGNRFENDAGIEIGEAITAQKARLFGIIFLTQGFDLTGLGRGIVHSLAGTNLPVAIIDENGFFTTENTAGLPRNVRIFDQTASRRSGLLAGRYLHAMGHRTLAYIDDGTGSEWSRNRLDGVRQAFAEVGMNNAVREVAFGCGLRTAPMPRDIHDIFDPALDTQSRRDLNMVMFTLKARFFSLLDQYGSARALAPYLKRLLDDGEITCWVCANDIVGMVVRHFLAGRGIKVPHRLSILAFDNTLRAVDGCFSSFSFNPEGVAAACMGHLANHPLWRGASRGDRIVEIDGHVHDRGSVRVLCGP